MPWAAEVIFKVPLPFNVRSSREKIAPSIFVSSFPAKELDTILFVLPSARVIKTLSACSTQIPAPSSFIMDTFSRISCTFSVLSVSTTTLPLLSEPVRRYVPPSVIVTVCPSIFTPSLSHFFSSSERLIAVHSLSSYSVSRSRSVNISSVSKIAISLSDMIVFSDPVVPFFAEFEVPWEHPVSSNAPAISTIIIYFLFIEFSSISLQSACLLQIYFYRLVVVVS